MACKQNSVPWRRILWIYTEAEFEYPPPPNSNIGCDTAFLFAYNLDVQLRFSHIYKGTYDLCTLIKHTQTDTILLLRHSVR